MMSEIWKFLEVVAPGFLYVSIMTGLVIWAIIEGTKHVE